MGLRFVYGRAGSGKTYFCLNEIKSRIENHTKHPLIFIVPEQASFQAERDLVSVLPSGGILNTEVLSFQRMAFRIFSEAGGITYPHIHPAGKSMILYRILDKMRDQFKLFSRSSSREGFVDTLSTQITEFKRYNVTTEHLEKALDEMEQDHPLREKLMELNWVFAEFNRVLAQRYRDSDDDLTLAAQKLSQISLYKGAEFWIDGFTNFTAQEYLLIGELIKQARNVTISFCCDSMLSADDYEADVFSPVTRAWKKLTQMAQQLQTGIDQIISVGNEPLPRFRESPELAHLEKNLNAYPYVKYQAKTEDISLLSALNHFSEIEECARDILRLCRDRGMRFRDIAVVTRNLPGYEKLIEVIFAEYQIPCFIDAKRDITDHPLIRLVLSMLEVFNEHWSYESVFRYLKTGLTGIEQQDIDRLENYVLACGIRGNQWTEDTDWFMSPDLLPDDQSREAHRQLLQEMNRIRRVVAEPLLAFRRQTKGRRGAADFCAGLYDFLCALHVPEAIEDNIALLKEKGELNLAGEYAQVWNTLMEVLDQMVEVMGEETFGLERFSKIINIGLSQYKIGLIPASLDQVLVGSVDRSKSHEIKALYLLGANDGVFPSAMVKEGILSDQDRLYLKHMGLELASDTRTQAFDEQFLVYRALTTPGQYLRVSWPIADHEGKTMRPSTVISRLKKIFPQISMRSNIIPTASVEEEMALVTEKMPTFKHMVSALRQKADGHLIQPVWEGVFKWFCKEEQWQSHCRSVRAAFGYTNLAQRIQGDKIRALYGDPAVSSVSRLERYTACPFAFYVQYGLGARERKIYRLSPPDIGTFMHAVIERFSRLVAQGEMTWRSLDKEWCNEQVSKIVDEMLQKMQGSGIAASRRFTALTARLKRVVARAVWLIAEHIKRSSFNPVDYEVGFGEGEKYPPILIELDSGEKIQLTGRIDRVDALKTEDGTYLRIIDYKSGAKDFRLSDVFYGLQVQLITYLDALWESGNREFSEKILPGGMLYFKIDDPIIKGNQGASEEDIELAIMRQLKMKGLLLADVKLIKEMDHTIEGSSLIIPATLNKGDVLGKNTSGASMDQFLLLRKYVRRLLKNMCTEIMRGHVDIRPCKKKGASSCQYCSFLPICQFDTAVKDNNYRLLFDKDNDEVWELMNREP